MRKYILEDKLSCLREGRRMILSVIYKTQERGAAMVVLTIKKKIQM